MRPLPMAEPVSSVGDRFDRPLRDLRISVTDLCSFRCGFSAVVEVPPIQFSLVNARTGGGAARGSEIRRGSGIR
jgi:hypothetical protein